MLTSGGHNAGIVSEPGHKGRRHQIRRTPQGKRYLPPQTWRKLAEQRNGSWWPALTGWLRERCSAQVTPPVMGAEQYPPRDTTPGPR